jgi:hypothetical protein
MRWIDRGCDSRAERAGVAAAFLLASFGFSGCDGEIGSRPAGGLAFAQDLQPTVNITGTIRAASSIPLAGVSIQLDQAAKAVTTTAADGTYAFLGLHRGAYSIQPSLTGCTFAPSVVTLPGLKADTVVDFTGSGPGCGPGRDAGTADGPDEAGARDGGAVESCAPRTCQQAAIACGPASDGCGHAIECGSCPSGSACSQQGQCVCQPATTCPAGQNCGTAPDGCGGTIACGSCSGTQTCGGAGVANVCGAAVPGCQRDTIACLETRDRPGDPPSTRCSDCVRGNGCLDPAKMGGACEDTSGNAPPACQAALTSASQVTETQLCLATLDKIFTSQCSSTLQLTPCLCGNTDPALCLAGMADPAGPLLPIYQCDLGASVVEISANFVDASRGAGQANALVQCAAAFGCNCF